ncbi:MATE family efflux transporter [Erythrobacter litoralis]|uniref:Multidrug-efflux transporter n=1 Tax=Erythrobacter litoralis (strain HTCC2594) TaxID=314225 RepID=Q2NCJ4_ERYLH|nr:MATE family efflux transporter [Erythrobacter litoralis]ABC62597.1 probable cation efflux pump (multidrug resistance protein) [Erythrobacter litoralis HTCC2594]
MDVRTRLFLTDPPGPLLVRMATPNSLAFMIQSFVSLGEVWIIGQLGTVSLAAIALSFPLLMLTQAMAGGAVGGAVTSSIARALGRGDSEAANRLIWHALAICAGGSALFLLLFLAAGESLLRFLGGSGIILGQAASYCLILFSGGLFLWLLGVTGAVFRGMGDMKTPAALMVLGAFVQVPLTAVLVLGLLGAPRLGIAGAAVSAVATGFLVSTVMLFLLTRPGRIIRLERGALVFERRLFRDIFAVAAPASLSPLLTILIILSLTAMIARFGEAALAGYGIGSRIEFLLIPLVFGIGAAMTSLVGLAIGAGDIARAERIGWTGGAMAAALAGVVGALLTLFPDRFIGAFTQDPEAFAAARSYVRIVGPFYAFQGLGLALYFASQGAGYMFWPVAATIARVALALGGGWWLGFRLECGLDGIYIAAAAAMAIYGLMMAGSVKLGAWRE